jgi:penicillin amidase
MKNPARGFVSSANQESTDPSYPYYLGAATNFPLYRGIIINRKLSGMSNITPIDMQRLQMDNYNVFAEMARPILLKFINDSLLSSQQIKYIDMLRKWDLNSDVYSKGATVFNAIWDSVEVALWADDFAKSSLPMGWPDESTLLESLIRNNDYPFSDDISTPDKKETLQDAILKGVKKACANLAILENAGNLEWSKFKDTKVVHLLKIDALSSLHLPIGGGRHIINATTENHGPSWRMIVHLTDDIEAYGVYPGGQNGNPGSKYYDSFVNSWATGKYYRILFLKKEQAVAHPQIKWRLSFSNV